MKNFNKEIGERIRFVRSIFNEGAKLSASQFAHLLGETMHKILNYELGRAQVPPSFLIALYRRGINPIYILTGEGSIFAPNKVGKELQRKLGFYFKELEQEEPNKSFELTNVSGDMLVDKSAKKLTEQDFDDLIELAKKYTAVAGDIMEMIKRRTQNE
ncbi:MAG: helix-turn-helix domain-containing protein [Ignavibacteria bacterium]|nr:helix-turn-helix domain-containing protein [Ignavibacteria bacterium]